MVRLIGGKGWHEGRVEVFWNQQWGTVCGGKSFDMKAGRVICRYLGYPGAVKVYNKPWQTVRAFGRGYGSVWFANMKCNGKEPTPYHCEMNAIGLQKCRHYLDVGVQCRLKS